MFCALLREGAKVTQEILFLLAGYFVPRAFDTKGFMKFSRDRFIRLGVPADGVLGLDVAEQF